MDEVSDAGVPLAKAVEELSTSGSGPPTSLGRLPVICAVVVALGGSSESVSIWIALPLGSITWLPVRWSTRKWLASRPKEPARV